MTQHAVKQAEEPVAPETKPPAGAMAMCPMAKMCMGMTEKRPSGLLLMLPGVLLIVVGVLIIMLLMMASFIRKVGIQLRM
jgi:hypothetical protein